MRILIVTRHLPWPLDSGGSAAQLSALKCLEGDHEFTLVCPIYDEAGMAHAKELQSHMPLVRVRAVYCGPPPQTDATARELLIAWLKGSVRFVKWLINLRGPQSSDASEDVPYYPFTPLPKNFIVALQEELKNGFDLCQLEFVETLPLGGWLPKEFPKLFIHHQLHFVYTKRFLDTKGRNSYLNYLELLIRTQEEAYLQQFDGVITFSGEDRDALLSFLPPEKVFTSPFPVPIDVGIARKLPPGFDGRFLFMASEVHYPNRDALEWLLTRVWPEVLRQLPASRLVVIGKWSGSSQRQLTAPGVSFSGFVTDLCEILRGGIMLVPLRIGSGIRVKIMTAMAQGVPVISTSVGSEGLLVRDGIDLLVRDGETEFVKAAVEVARNPELWNRLGAAGMTTASRHYSAEGVRQRRNEIYSMLTNENQSMSTGTVLTNSHKTPKVVEA